MVGVLNTIFGYCVFALCIFLGLHYSIAIIISTAAGVLFNFHTIGRLVFKSHKNSRIFKFVGVYVVVYFLNLGGQMLLHIATPNRYLEQAILALPLALVGFVLNSRLVFNDKLSSIGN